MLNMSEFKSDTVVRDNVIAINGVEVGKLSDTEAEKIISIVKAMLNGCSADVIETKTVAKPKKVRDYPDLPKPTDVKVGLKWLDDNHFILGTYCAKATTMAFRKMLADTISYDGDYVRDDVYKRNYGAHKVGEHKKGAWKLEKASDNFNHETGSFTITADAIQGARDDIKDHIAAREARLD